MSTARKPSSHELNALASNVVRLSKLLTGEREGLPVAYLKDNGLRMAYLHYFLPSNLLKIHTPLQELSLHPKNILSKEKLKVLDLGSGPGTALLGVLKFFSRQDEKPKLEFTAVDQVAENLKEAEKLFLSYGKETALHASLKIIQSGIEGVEHLLHERFDVIILSNVLNELFLHNDERTGKRVNILNSILSRLLTDGGSCIIIEPALRETSREMLEVREGLLCHGFHVYSPCLVSGKCPALANPKDWCHEDITWEPPDLVKEIDTLTGLRKDSLKFSYLVLRKDALSVSDVCGKHAFRVVSEPLVSKGKIEFYICGPGGRRLIARLDRDRTSLNQAFEKLKRGNMIGFEQLIDEGKRFKAGKETKVTFRS